MSSGIYGWVTSAALTVLLTPIPSLGQGLKAKFDEVRNPQITSVAVAEAVECRVDGMQLHLQSGSLGWGALVNGAPTALVFGGQGWLDIPLPGPIEEQQVQLFTGGQKLRIEFRSAVFRFADAARLRRALGTQVRFRGERAAAGLLGAILADRERADLRTGGDVPVRILDALSAGPDGGAWLGELLLAQFQRHDGSWVHIDVDPFSTAPLRVYTDAKTDVPAGPGRPRLISERFQNVWTELELSGVSRAEPPWQATRYKFDIDLSDKTNFQASEMMVLTAASTARGILLRLDGKFRVGSARKGQGGALEFLQAPDPRGNFADGYAGNWLYLELPTAVQPGAHAQVTLTVTGKNAFASGTRGNFHAWTWPDLAWYPLDPYGGATPRAQFEVATRRTGRVTARQILAAHWGLHGELPMTGFGLQVTAVPRKRTGQLVDDPALDQAALPGGSHITLVGVPHLFHTDTYNGRMRQVILDALTFYSSAFGSLPLTQLGLSAGQPATRYSPVNYAALNRQPGELDNLRSSQPIPAPRAGWLDRDAPSWPGLMMVNPQWADQALYGPKTQTSYGKFWAPRLQLFDITPAHVVAHQWWGDWVGWASLQDSWLGEALANGSAVIFAAHEFGGATAAAIRQGWLEELTTKDVFGRVPNELGPLCLGPRLSSSLDPTGYDLVAQDKGGYVIEMLRAMMGEERFRAAMHDLTGRYGNRNISVAEFERLWRRT